jgi:dGTPase
MPATPGTPRAAGGEHLLELRRRLEQAEADRLSPAGCPSSAAVRRRPDPGAETGHRLAFALDADRVLHSLAYTRYIDKTQVFSLMPNDHITHRVLHVQLVSKIGRTVGRMLGLNEDLVEAIALAHDIGHPPFGHDGESYLSAKCREHGLPPFQHNLQSVHFLEQVEKGGRGLNLSLQVLDGVLCHDGEVHTARLTPCWRRDFAGLEAELAAKAADPGHELVPMTLEGCVVRICDTVAYVGRDFEDAIAVGLIQRRELPGEVSEVLGDTNGRMVYRLVEDLVAGSGGGRDVGFSPEVGEALRRLKRFNLERIYLDPRIKVEHPKIRRAFDLLFERFLADLEAGRRQSPLFTDFLDHMEPDYLQRQSPPEVVRDYLAGMTDEHFLTRYGEITWPRRLPSRLPPRLG